MVPGATRNTGSRLANVGTPDVGVNVTVGAWAAAAPTHAATSTQLSDNALVMAVLS